MLLKHKIVVLLLGMAVLFCAGPALASPTLDTTQTWTGTSINGWTNTDAEAVLDNPGSGGNTGGGSDGYLRIKFPDQGGPPMEQSDTIRSTNVADTGNYQQYWPYMQVSFDFKGEAYAPVSPALYFETSVGGGDTWIYSFTYETSSVGSWVNFAVPFQYDADAWSSIGGGGATEFYNALAAVDWIGINLSRNLDDSGDQFYGLDNWKYYEIIPEPGSLCMLGVALSSLAEHA